MSLIRPNMNHQDTSSSASHRSSHTSSAPILHLKFFAGPRPPQFAAAHRYAHEIAADPASVSLPEGLRTDVQRDGIARYLVNNFKLGTPVFDIIHERPRDSNYIMVSSNWHRSAGDGKLHLSLYIYKHDHYVETWHAYTDRSISYQPEPVLDAPSEGTATTLSPPQPEPVSTSQPTYKPKPSRVESDLLNDGDEKSTRTSFKPDAEPPELERGERRRDDDRVERQGRGQDDNKKQHLSSMSPSASIEESGRVTRSSKNDKQVRRDTGSSRPDQLDDERYKEFSDEEWIQPPTSPDRQEISDISSIRSDEQIKSDHDSDDSTSDNYEREKVDEARARSAPLAQRERELESLVDKSRVEHERSGDGSSSLRKDKDKDKSSKPRPQPIRLTRDQRPVASKARRRAASYSTRSASSTRSRSPWLASPVPVTSARQRESSSKKPSSMPQDSTPSGSTDEVAKLKRQLREMEEKLRRKTREEQREKEANALVEEAQSTRARAELREDTLVEEMTPSTRSRTHRSETIRRPRPRSVSPGREHQQRPSRSRANSVAVRPDPRHDEEAARGERISDERDGDKSTRRHGHRRSKSVPRVDASRLDDADAPRSTADARPEWRAERRSHYDTEGSGDEGGDVRESSFQVPGGRSKRATRRGDTRERTEDHSKSSRPRARSRSRTAQVEQDVPVEDVAHTVTDQAVPMSNAGLGGWIKGVGEFIKAKVAAAGEVENDPAAQDERESRELREVRRERKKLKRERRRLEELDQERQTGQVDDNDDDFDADLNIAPRVDLSKKPQARDDNARSRRHSVSHAVETRDDRTRRRERDPKPSDTSRRPTTRQDDTIRSSRSGLPRNDPPEDRRSTTAERRKPDIESIREPDSPEAASPLRERARSFSNAVEGGIRSATSTSMKAANDRVQATEEQVERDRHANRRGRPSRATSEKEDVSRGNRSRSRAREPPPQLDVSSDEESDPDVEVTKTPPRNGLLDSRSTTSRARSSSRARSNWRDDRGDEIRTKPDDQAIDDGQHTSSKARSNVDHSDDRARGDRAARASSRPRTAASSQPPPSPVAPQSVRNELKMKQDEQRRQRAQRDVNRIPTPSPVVKPITGRADFVPVDSLSPVPSGHFAVPLPPSSVARSSFEISPSTMSGSRVANAPFGPTSFGPPPSFPGPAPHVFGGTSSDPTLTHVTPSHAVSMPTRDMTTVRESRGHSSHLRHGHDGRRLTRPKNDDSAASGSSLSDDDGDDDDDDDGHGSMFSEVPPADDDRGAYDSDASVDQWRRDRVASFSRSVPAFSHEQDTESDEESEQHSARPGWTSTRSFSSGTARTGYGAGMTNAATLSDDTDDVTELERASAPRRTMVSSLGSRGVGRQDRAQDTGYASMRGANRREARNGGSSRANDMSYGARRMTGDRSGGEERFEARTESRLGSGRR